MLNYIDGSDGSIRLGDGLVIGHNMTEGQLRATGVGIVREIDMKTGWRAISVGPRELFERDTYFTLYFFNGYLKHVHLVLSGGGVTTPQDLKQLHDNVLAIQFGVPQKADTRSATYGFSWGSLVSEFDPRGMQSMMVLSWK
jgi:hypothetical protein